MGMFYYWREFQGENHNYLMLLSFMLFVVRNLIHYLFRRDSRKVVLLQHGILDSSMGWVPTKSSDVIGILYSLGHSPIASHALWSHVFFISFIFFWFSLYLCLHLYNLNSFATSQASSSLSKKKVVLGLSCLNLLDSVVI